MAFMFGRRSGALVGVDIGAAAIKAVEMSPAGPKFAVHRIGVGSTPVGAIKNGVPTDVEVLGGAIREVLSAAGIRGGGRVVSGLAGEAVIVRELKLPEMATATLSQAVQFEAGRFLPYAVRDAVVDYDVIEEVREEGQKKLELLMVATRRETVDRLLSALHRGGVEPEVFDVKPFAVMRALGGNAGTDGAVQVFAHIGAETTDILIMDGRYLRLTRSVGFGGNEMTRAVAAGMGLEFAAAETLKRAKAAVLLEGEPRPEDASVESVYQAIFPVISDLAREVRRSIDYFQTRWRERRIERVLLSGAPAGIKNLAQFLTLELGVPAVIGDPFAKCEVPESVLSAAQRRELGPSLAAAVGLAMRGAEEQ